MNGQAIINEARVTGGFLTSSNVATIAADPDTSSTLLLVRCGGGRFMCPAHDVRHFIGVVDCEVADHVRDVSLPVSGTAVLVDLMTALRSVRLALPVAAIAALEKAEEALRI